MTQRTGQLRKAAPTVAFKRQAPPKSELLLTCLGTEKESQDHSNDNASFYEQVCSSAIDVRLYQSTEWKSTTQQTKLDACFNIQHVPQKQTLERGCRAIVVISC